MIDLRGIEESLIQRGWQQMHHWWYLLWPRWHSHSPLQEPAIRPCCIGVGPLFVADGSGVAGASAAIWGANPPMSMVAVSLEVRGT